MHIGKLAQVIESIEEQRNIMEFIDRFMFGHKRDGAMVMHRDAMHRCGDGAMRYASRSRLALEHQVDPYGVPESVGVEEDPRYRRSQNFLLYVCHCLLGDAAKSSLSLAA